MARLRAELSADRAALVSRLADGREGERRLRLEPDDPGALAIVAVALHAWYTGLEMIFERVARELDGELPTGDRWHRSLLTQMATEIPGVRPAVIDVGLLEPLAALLAFRHFFRHAYAVGLRAERLRVDVERLLRVGPEVETQLDAFASFLRAAGEQLE